MLRSSCVIISNDNNKTYFKSNNYCQSHGSLDGYVPCTHYYPSNVAPRPSLPDGIIKSEQDVITIFYNDYEEISNPLHGIMSAMIRTGIPITN